MSSVAFRIFATLVASLEENQQNGQIITAQIREDYNARPDNGTVYSILLCHYDGTETEHRFVFFDEEESEAYSIVRRSSFFKEWDYRDYLDN